MRRHNPGVASVHIRARQRAYGGLAAGIFAPGCIHMHARAGVRMARAIVAEGDNEKPQPTVVRRIEALEM